MNDFDLCLEVVSRSRQPLHYSWRWISRKPLEIEVWFQRTTNRKWPMGYQVRCEVIRSAILAIAWLLVFIFCCYWSDAVNWCDKLRVCIYISCFIAGFSYRTTLVSKQSWLHSHSLNYIHDSLADQRSRYCYTVASVVCLSVVCNVMYCG